MKGWMEDGGQDEYKYQVVTSQVGHDIIALSAAISTKNN